MKRPHSTKYFIPQCARMAVATRLSTAADWTVWLYRKCNPLNWRTPATVPLRVGLFSLDSSQQTSFLHTGTQEIRDLTLDQSEQFVAAVSMDQDCKVFIVNDHVCLAWNSIGHANGPSTWDTRMAAFPRTTCGSRRRR